MPEAAANDPAQARAAEFRSAVHLRDPRFCYGLLQGGAARVPSRPRRLLVAVHGSERNHIDCLQGFAALAAAHELVVLAPLFPANVLGDGNPDGYKFLQEGDIRYDLMLLDMVREVAAQTGCDAQRFLLHGYSGGAQFVHRFAYLHPRRLLAVAVAAPGVVTLADDRAGWWTGVGDVEARFGQPVDWSQVAQVGWHLLVGEGDVHTAQLKEQPPSSWWHDDAQRLQSNRKDRLQLLWRSLRARAVPATLDVMPGVDHGAGRAPAMRRAQAYFAEHLSRSRG